MAILGEFNNEWLLSAAFMYWTEIDWIKASFRELEMYILPA
jgi:hypothetical protein